MADKTPQPPVKFVDNPHAPEVFATDVAGFFLLDGNMIIALESARVDHSTSPGPVNRVVVARVAMSVPAAQRLAVGLYDFLKQKGLDPAGVIKTEGDPTKPQ